MVGLPTGTVTFLFSDVEGSTALLERLGDAHAGELGEHRAIVRDAVASNGGEIVDQRGEEVFAAFAETSLAVDAAVAIQRRHAGRLMRVRIGLHTGEPSLTGEGYLGLDVHRAARICAAGHGGQVLLSVRTRELVADRSAKDLGSYLLHGISTPERLYQLLEPGLGHDFVALRVLPAPGDGERKLMARLPGHRPGEPTLEQLAWAARARLPALPADERLVVARVAGALAAASRSATAANRLTASVDRRGLERRLSAYRAMSGTSNRAATAAKTVERQLEHLDAVRDRGAEVERVARGSSPEAEKVQEAASALDVAVAEARATIGKAGGRTRRTLFPGVRRLGHEYVVVAFDDAGIEHVNVFETMREARAFRRVVHLSEQRKRESQSPSGDVGNPPGSVGHAGGGGDGGADGVG
jgi:class 3 adenylate cyclase